MGREMVKRWQKTHVAFDIAAYEAPLTAIIEAVRAEEDFNWRALQRILHRYPRDGDRVFSKDQLVLGYRALCTAGRFPFEREVLRRLQMKPVRTASGVAPVAVLTKPYPCPGRCIFCPDDARMPKSYLHDEPGAMRAELNEFDPYRQVASRIESLEAIGHTTDKVELLILGGTWSAYPKGYQEWFVRRCLDAMNGRESASLEEAQRLNEDAPHRNVGLVIETRPDWISPAEVRWLRRLGVTKVQLGAQSLDDRILALNRRGHAVETTRRAVRLLRLAGFKLHLHWMPNLLGATPESDLADFRRLWDDPALRPDELKIYPTALLRNTELYRHWENGEYQPYTREALIGLLAACKAMVPRYCRLNRVIRDIPAGHIVAGNKESHLRQVVQAEMRRQGLRCQCIRCREVGQEEVRPETLHLEEIGYDTDVTEERFLSFVTPQDRLAAFLRLSLPRDRSASAELLAELRDCAMIREVHVYGPALGIGSESMGEAQHLGLGRRLIQRAAEIARAEGYGHLAVIAAIGTRRYYRRLGFEPRGSYMVRPL
jgi:elongator complex protein 3